jgi:hypothetical protein
MTAPRRNRSWAGLIAALLSEGKRTGQGRSRTLGVERLEDRITLDATSASVEGINSRGLQTLAGKLLTGDKIPLGQVEPYRPGKPGYDNATNSNPTVKPAGVYRMGAAASKNQDVRDSKDTTYAHGEWVASVMIADNTNGNTQIGVSPGARLYATSLVHSYGSSQITAAVASQRIADLNNGDVRAINFSYGVNARVNNPTPDGSEPLTKFMDWSARAQNTLYVVAGRTTNSGPIPRISSTGSSFRPRSKSTASSPGWTTRCWFGQLNASRALKQFSPGNYSPASGAVPAIGWSYVTSPFTDQSDLVYYPISGQLKKE